MSGVLSREVLAQVAIIMAVCVGGWLVLVDPKVDELHELEAIIAECSSNPFLDERAIARFADRMKPLRERSAEIRVSNGLARDFARLYAVLRDQADEHRVQVQSLQPGGVMDRDGDSPISVTQVDMTVEGSFESVCAFLESVDRLDCFVRPSSLTVIPQQAEGQQRVVARYGFEAVSFNLSALTEFANADR